MNTPSTLETYPDAADPGSTSNPSIGILTVQLDDRMTRALRCFEFTISLCPVGPRDSAGIKSVFLHPHDSQASVT